MRRIGACPLLLVGTARLLLPGAVRWLLVVRALWPRRLLRMHGNYPSPW